MKKNWTMRVGALMLALTLITSCFVGGTFAKYITAADGADSARVAKFGVEVTAGGNLFDSEYATHDTEAGFGYTGEYSVEAGNGTDKVVAPGTSSEDLGLFTIKGTPEVAVNVAVTLEDAADVSMITLPAGTYTDYTKVTGYDATGKATYGTFSIEEPYNPIVWTLTDGNGVETTGTLAEIAAKVESLSNNFDPNTNLATALGNGAYTLSWSWAYESGNDAADTYLGNVAAGIVENVPTGVVTTESFDFGITVTQID